MKIYLKVKSIVKRGYITVGIILFASLFGFLTNVAADYAADLEYYCDTQCQPGLGQCRLACDPLSIPGEDIGYNSPFRKCNDKCPVEWRKCWDACMERGEIPEEITNECGNDICDAGEDCSNCLSDCSCSSGEICQTSDSDANAHGCVISKIDLTISTDKKIYSPKETVIIRGSVLDAKGGLDGAVVAMKVSSAQFSATASVTADSSGNYRLEFPIPPDVTQAVYTLLATVSYSGYPSISKSTSFVVGEISMQLEENAATGELFIGVAADGASSLGISISLPGCSEGCSDVKVGQPDIGKLEGNVIDATGNIKLDSTGVAKITYHPPDYLTKDQLTRNINVHQSGSRAWAAEVPLTLTYTDAGGQEGKIEAEILVCRPPVMLVHGFLGATATWGKMSTYLNGERFDTYMGNYGATGQSIEGLSLVLKQDIQKQKVDYANSNIKLEKVDAVGHSMGGLISRYYSNGLSDYPGDMRKLIMVGTPNHGISWIKKITGNIGAGWYQTHKIPAGQLYSESPFMKTLNSGEKAGAHLNPDIQYGNIYGWSDDWIVSAASAYLNGVNSVLESDVKHSPDIPGVPAVAITEYLKTWEQVKSWLTSDIYRPPLKGSRVEVHKYLGDVYLVNYDSSGGHENKLASSPTKFDSWQSLRTGQDSTAIVRLTLNDIPWGVIFLDPESEIFLGYYSPQLVEVRLWKGSAAFRSGKDGHFTVPVNIKRSDDGEWWKYSPQAVVTGRGTEFAVTAGKNIEVHCLEGGLVVDTPNATEEGTILSANNSVAVDEEAVVAINPASKDDFWWKDISVENYGGTIIVPEILSGICQMLPESICQNLLYIIVGFFVLIILLLLIKILNRRK